MYRRVNSGGFIGAMTLGIVIVMAVFTWVMWGMAKEVLKMTDVMVEVNASFKRMADDVGSMNGNLINIRDSMVVMEASISELSGNIGNMDDNLASIDGGMDEINASMSAMTQSIYVMNGNMSRMTMDVGRASYAFSNPINYMFGGSPMPMGF